LGGWKEQPAFTHTHDATRGLQTFNETMLVSELDPV